MRWMAGARRARALESARTSCCRARGWRRVAKCSSAGDGSMLAAAHKALPSFMVRASPLASPAWRQERPHPHGRGGAQSNCRRWHGGTGRPWGKGLAAGGRKGASIAPSVRKNGTACKGRGPGWADEPREPTVAGNLAQGESSSRKGRSCVVCA